MTEIDVNWRLGLCFAFLLVWCFGWGVYLQAKYNISAIDIPITDNMVYAFLGFVVGVTGYRIVEMVRE